MRFRSICHCVVVNLENLLDTRETDLTLSQFTCKSLLWFKSDTVTKGPIKTIEILGYQNCTIMLKGLKELNWNKWIKIAQSKQKKPKLYNCDM